ncbi:MAG: threonine/serine dehydratase [Alsobacter sp.]
MTDLALPVTYADIRAARERIRPHVRRTPVMSVEAGALGPAAVTFKLEHLQHAGSFKARGAFNNLLSREVPGAGVTAVSGGNHGIAVALAARRLGHPATIFVPEISPPVKLAAIRAQGAEVVVSPRFAEALEACQRHASGTGALFVHPFDMPETLAGQGTVALEWQEDHARMGIAPLDTVLVAVGGGGLAAGMAAWFAGRTRVVGVEPEGCRSLHAALEAGQPVEVEVRSVAADSLGAPRAGDLVFAVASQAMAGVVLVRDEDIVAAQQRLWRDWRIAVEPGGATALAALTGGAYRAQPGERVGVLLCGANVDPATLA